MLHDKISSEWRWNHWPLAGNDGISKVLLDSSPLSMLSSLRWDGDINSSCSDKLSIIIELSVKDIRRRRVETAQDQAVNDQILPHVVHATVLVSSKDSNKFDNHLWFNIFLLNKALASRSPHLTTLKIIAHGSADVTSDWNEAPELTKDIDHLPSPYASLAGLPLRRRSRLRWSDGECTERDQCRSADRPTHNSKDSTTGELHTFFRQGVCTYTSEDAAA